MTELPNSWSVVALEELFELVLGGDWGKDPAEALEDSSLVRCIRAAELSEWDVGLGKSAATRRLKNSSIEKRRLRSGDILVEVSGGGPDQPVGRAVLITPSVLRRDESHDFVCTNFFRFCRPVEHIDSSYLSLYLRHFYSIGGTEALQGGSNNLRNLRFPDYLAQQVPVAPLNEQRRIVAKIEELFSELDKGVESLTTAREQLKAYRQSVLKAAFDGTLTEEWRLNNANTLESPGHLLARIKNERESRFLSALDEWKLALENLRSGSEKPSKPKRPRELSPLANSGKNNGVWPILELGDLLSVSSGQGLTAQQMRDGPYAVYGGNGINGCHDEYFLEEPELVIGRVGAKCGVTHITLPKSWVTDNALIVTALISSFDKRFFKWLLEIKNLNVLGSSTGQPVISGSKIYPVEIGLPSYAEQLEIVRILDRKLEAADVMDGEIEAGLARADALRQSILKRAFSGKLVAKDAEDEPASVLLERIRAEREEGGATKRRNNKNGKKEAA